MCGPGKFQWDKLHFPFIPSVHTTFSLKNKTRMEAPSDYEVQAHLGATVLLHLLHERNRKKEYYIQNHILTDINIILCRTFPKLGQTFRLEALDLFPFVKNYNSFICLFIYAYTQSSAKLRYMVPGAMHTEKKDMVPALKSNWGGGGRNPASQQTTI